MAVVRPLGLEYQNEEVIRSVVVLAGKRRDEQRRASIVFAKIVSCVS
jgi:hypothetical protein